jgi:hypothetical protein
MFTKSEVEILMTRSIRDDPSKAHRFGKPVQLRDIKDTFRDWRIYGHLVSGFLSMWVTTLNSGHA